MSSGSAGSVGLDTSSTGPSKTPESSGQTGSEAPSQDSASASASTGSSDGGEQANPVKSSDSTKAPSDVDEEPDMIESGTYVIVSKKTRIKCLTWRARRLRTAAALSSMTATAPTPSAGGSARRVTAGIPSRLATLPCALISRTALVPTARMSISGLATAPRPRNGASLWARGTCKSCLRWPQCLMCVEC